MADSDGGGNAQIHWKKKKRVQKAGGEIIHSFMVSDTPYMFQGPTKRKEVKYSILVDCLTENLDLLLFMIISSFIIMSLQSGGVIASGGKE